jgi:hypothetical protein
MLHENAVFEYRRLGTVTKLPNDHDPIDGLATGQELRLGQDRGPSPALFPSIPPALPFGFQARGAGNALYLVNGLTGLTNLDDDVRVVAYLGLTGTTTTAGSTPPSYRTVIFPDLLELLLGLLVSRFLSLSDPLGLVLKFFSSALAPATATATTPPSVTPTLWGFFLFFRYAFCRYAILVGGCGRSGDFFKRHRFFRVGRRATRTPPTGGCCPRLLRKLGSSKGGRCRHLERRE